MKAVLAEEQKRTPDIDVAQWLVPSGDGDGDRDKMQIDMGMGVSQDSSTRLVLDERCK
jgi:hypothetical protein